jgi:uncharacterized RDD family membrane protein YckC
VLAHNVDLVFILPFLYLLSAIIPDNLLLYPTAAFFYLLYYAGFESSSWRATPGKRFLKIQIICNSSKPGVYALRNIYKILSAIPLFFGFTYAAFNKERKTLHDILAKCSVVDLD